MTEPRGSEELGCVECGFAPGAGHGMACVSRGKASYDRRAIEKPRRWTIGPYKGMSNCPTVVDSEDEPENGGYGPDVSAPELVMPVSEHEEYAARVMPVLLEVENLKVEAADLACSA